MDATKIGTFIAAERRAKGWTQRQLADKLQLTDKAVSRWETGKGLPDVSFLLPLAAALDVSVGELLAGESQPQPPAVQAAETRTAEQLASYTRELGPQLRLHSAGRVVAVCRSVFISAISAAVDGRGGHPWSQRNVSATACRSAVCFCGIRLLAAAPALHGWPGGNAGLAPCICYGRGWAVAVRFVLCHSIFRMCSVPGAGFLARPVVAGKCKSGAVSANHAVPALSGAGAGVLEWRWVCVPRTFCLLDELFRVFRAGSAAAAHLAPLARGRGRRLACRVGRQCDRGHAAVCAHRYRIIPV